MDRHALSQDRVQTPHLIPREHAEPAALRGGVTGGHGEQTLGELRGAADHAGMKRAEGSDSSETSKVGLGGGTAGLNTGHHCGSDPLPRAWLQVCVGALTPGLSLSGTPPRVLRSLESQEPPYWLLYE